MTHGRPTRAQTAQRERYCTECGRPMPGPLAERMHACDDRQTGARWHDLARGGRLPARVEYIA